MLRNPKEQQNVQHKYSNRVCRGMTNDSLMSMFVGMMRDYYDPATINHNTNLKVPRPSRQDISSVVTEILFRMENGHQDNPMPDFEDKE